jgi:acyl dehydratase
VSESAAEPAVNYVTEEVRAFIGRGSDTVVAVDEVELGAVRRFAQAIMDDDPNYWDDDAAAASRFGGLVTPPLYPLHAFRRASGTPDPLAAATEDPDYDGAGQGLAGRLGLPPLPLDLKRMLNGGNDVEIYALARPGDRIQAHSRYLDVYQKEGRSGPLVFVIIETTYETTTGTRLLVSRQTQVWR